MHFIVSVNVGQTCFESISVIVKRLHGLLEDRNDQHGRNMVLASYIHYNCTLPHPDLSSGKYPSGCAVKFHL